MTEIISTKLGKIEVEVNGTGIPILAIHGSPGGIDSAKMMLRFLPTNQFQTIAFSRPGYLGTPLDDNDRSIDHEADLIAALLDELNIKRVSLLAWSGGGPSAYRFAVRHTERIASLIAIAAVSEQWICPKYPVFDRFLFGTTLGKFFIKLAAKYAPKNLISGALASEGDLTTDEIKSQTSSIMSDDEQYIDILNVAKTMSWAGKRKKGWDNDVANYAAISSLELSKIQCPVLLIHGYADTDAVPSYSLNAHQELPNSKLIMIEHGTHIAFYAHPQAKQTQQFACQWLIEHQ